MRAYIDADVLIWHLRGNTDARNFLKKTQQNSQYDIWISAMQRAEIVFFMRPNEEKNTLLFLSQFKTSPIDQTIVDLAGSIYRQWNPSHGVDVNDAFLAATTLQTGGCIFTKNIKHFPTPELNVHTAW